MRIVEIREKAVRISSPIRGPRNGGKWQPISFEQLVKELVEGGDVFGEGHVDGFPALRELNTPIDPAAPELGRRRTRSRCCPASMTAARPSRATSGTRPTARCSRRDAAGTPMGVLKELRGWRDSRMMERYAHLAPGYAAAYADIREDHRGKPIESTLPDYQRTSADLMS